MAQRTRLTCTAASAGSVTARGAHALAGRRNRLALSSMEEDRSQGAATRCVVIAEGPRCSGEARERDDRSFAVAANQTVIGVLVTDLHAVRARLVQYRVVDVVGVGGVWDRDIGRMAPLVLGHALERASAGRHAAGRHGLGTRPGGGTAVSIVDADQSGYLCALSSSQLMLSHFALAHSIGTPDPRADCATSDTSAAMTRPRIMFCGRTARRSYCQVSSLSTRCGDAYAAEVVQSGVSALDGGTS